MESKPLAASQKNAFSQRLVGRWPTLLVIPLLAVFSALLVFRVMPHFPDAAGIDLARLARTLSISLDESLEQGVSLSVWLQDTRADYGLLRVFFMLPFALAYWQLGFSLAAFLITPFIFHLLSGLILLRLAREILPDRAAAFLAVLLWLSFPAATAVTASSPLAAPILFVVLLALTTALLMIKKRSIPAALAFVLIMAFLFLVWPSLSLAVLVFTGLTWLFEVRRSSSSVLLIVLASVAALVFFVPHIASQTRVLLSQLYRTPGFLLLLLLFFTAYAFYQTRPVKSLQMIAPLSLFGYLAYFCRFVFVPQDWLAENLGDFSSLLLLLPVTLLIAHVLTHWLNGRQALIASGLGLSLGIWFVAGADLSFSLNSDLFSAGPYISLSRFVAGMLVLALFLYLLANLTLERAFDRHFATLMLLTIPVTSIFPLAALNLNAGSSYKALLGSLGSIVEQQGSPDMYACSRQLGVRLWYMNGFRAIGQPDDGRAKNPFQRLPANVSNLDQGIAVLDAFCDELDDDLLQTWTRIFSVGEGRHQLDLYQIGQTDQP